MLVTLRSLGRGDDEDGGAGKGEDEDGSNSTGDSPSNEFRRPSVKGVLNESLEDVIDLFILIFGV
jgi:hypothetical protein